MNQAPQGGPSRSPRREGAGPPTTLGGKGGLVYGSRRDGGSLTGLGDGPPTGGGWGGFKMGWARVRGLSVEGWGVGVVERRGEGASGPGCRPARLPPGGRREGREVPGRPSESPSRPGRRGRPCRTAAAGQVVHPSPSVAAGQWDKEWGRESMGVGWEWLGRGFSAEEGRLRGPVGTGGPPSRPSKPASIQRSARAPPPDTRSGPEAGRRPAELGG